MIQRIQTLYLFLAAVVMSLTLFLPLGTIAPKDYPEMTLKAYTIENWPAAELGTDLQIYLICLCCLLALPTLMSLVIIFLYKNRLLQIRLCVSEIVLLVGALAFIGIYCYRLCEIIPMDAVFTIGFTSLMPVFAIVFVVFAIRGIAKDEALVRSLDRIR